MLYILYRDMTQKETGYLSALFQKLNKREHEFVQVTQDLTDEEIERFKLNELLLIKPNSESSVFFKRIGSLKDDENIPSMPRPFEGLFIPEKREESIIVLRQFKDERTVATLLAQDIPTLSKDKIEKLLNNDRVFRIAIGHKNIIVVPNDYDGDEYEDAITVNDLVLMYMIKYTFNVKEIKVEKNEPRKEN